MSQSPPDVNPYDSPRAKTAPDPTARTDSRLDRFGRGVILTALIYMALYAPYFMVQSYRSMSGAEVSPWAIFPPHFVGMALNFTAFGFSIRDLYLRPFPNPNSKVTWVLLIVFTGGIGWLFYIVKYALKPRLPIDNAGE